MQNDIDGGGPSRKKPKLDELDLNQGAGANSDTSGPEADEIMAFAETKQKTPSHLIPDEELSMATVKEPAKSGKKLGWRQRLTANLSKKQKIIALAAAIVLVIGSGALAFDLTHSGPIKTLTVHATPKVKPKIYSPLSGREVTEKQSKLPVTGVMIENSVPARPQSGLSQAGVVYEAIAEAGITRFFALFQENEPGSIGPIRSARPYFVRWDNGYNAPYAHVGGSPEAIHDIRAWDIKDMDQFYAGDYYHRISSRYAPHNMYTSMAKLHQLEKARHWYKPPSFTGFARKDNQPAKKPSARIINMNPSYPDYAVKYVYDKKTDTYKRYMGGSRHIDAANGKQIRPNVVVALIIPYGIEADGYHSTYDNIGNGTAYVFQDGKVTKGAWSKPTRQSPLKLIDKAGKEIRLNRGQTWLTALGSTSRLSYRP